MAAVVESSKQYKKRVIQASSSDEDEVEAAPPVKRPKAEVPIATPIYAPSAPPFGSTDARAPPPMPPVKAEPKESLVVFTTGGSDSEEDKPRGKGKMNGNGNGKKRAATSSSSDEEPLARAKKEGKKEGKNKASSEPAVKKVKAAKPAVKAEDSSDDETPLAKVVKPVAKPVKKEADKNAQASSSKPTSKVKPTPSKDSDSGDDTPLSKSTPASKAKPPVKSESKVAKVKPAAKAAAVKKEGVDSPKKKTVKGKGKAEGSVDGTNGGEEDGEEESYRWWEHDDDGDTKWRTLEHNGVLFPPEYEPHGIQMRYNGKFVKLPPPAEEVASFFAAILETDYPKNPVFVKNFFSSWLDILKSHPPTCGTKIDDFKKCDFRPIFDHLETEKAVKKSISAAEKKAVKAARDELEEPYKTCLLDGRVEKLGNFRVEPPGLFRGRGEHPKTGLLKTRVTPEMITINIGAKAKIPPPPEGTEWGGVVHNDAVTWLATWKENINNAVKYVFLAAGSSLKGQSDFKKFEKARLLKEHIATIRRDYTKDLVSSEMATRQRATAIYFIDRFALRNGNEKGEDEADTVGCCSLRFEHVTLTPPTGVTFDFLGKDSIRYTNNVEVDPQVFKNLMIFKKSPKEIGDTLFDRISTAVVNKYLTSYMAGLTAKVFRTYNASWTFSEQLADTPADGTIAEKILAYNRANRAVAVLCNHQRSVSKGHGLVMDKLTDKIRALKYLRKKLRYALLHMASSKDRSKKYKQYEEEESDLEDDWIETYEETLVTLEREKITKKFEKENKKLVEEDEPPLPASVLATRLEAADNLEDNLERDKASGWTDNKPNHSEDKIIGLIQKLDEKIVIAKNAALDRDEGKEVSLGTSKINYLDPRITLAWCKKHDVPVAKMFSKTLLEKFTWAVDVDEDWEF